VVKTEKSRPKILQGRVKFLTRRKKSEQLEVIFEVAEAGSCEGSGALERGPRGT